MICYYHQISRNYSICICLINVIYFCSLFIVTRTQMKLTLYEWLTCVLTFFHPRISFRPHYFCPVVYLLKNPGHVWDGVSSLWILQLASPGCHLMGSSVLCTSCTQTGRSRDLLALRSLCECLSFCDISRIHLTFHSSSVCPFQT